MTDNGSRILERIVLGQATSDGDGVKLTRFIGTQELDMLDPFLMLDFFESDQAADYIGGFPSHPHRGFQTVTYMLAGKMRHEDNVGHEGVIEAGDIQWMNAGRGVIHSEMPEQEDGLLSGFQLWVNLPAAEKMSAPTYQEFASANIPVDIQTDGVAVKVIAGNTDGGTTGPVDFPATAPLYLDVRLDSDAGFSQALPKDHSAFVYVIDGAVRVADGMQSLGPRHLGVLGDGDHVRITTGDGPGRFLLVAGRRLDEPVARGGPFVMNTKDELMQAFDDYRAGRF